MPASLPLPFQDHTMPFETREHILMSTFPILRFAEGSQHNKTGAPLTDESFNVGLKGRESRHSCGTYL